MLRKTFIAGFGLLIFLELLGQPQRVAAVGVREAGASAQIRTQEADQERLEDERLIKLESFLDSKDSPLAEYAKDFIFFADQFNIDWRLLPAIAGIESNFGKVILSNSYNPYGWGNGQIYFSSWPESIKVVSQALLENYYQKGLNTPEKIGPAYAPPSPNWASKIRVIMNQIDQIELPLEPKI